MVAIRNFLAAAMALAAPISAALTPTQISDNIRSLTEKSQALQAPAQSLTILDGPLLLTGQGNFPPIIKGFTEIVNVGTAAINQMKGTAPIPAGADSDSIFNAFRDVRLYRLSRTDNRKSS